MIVRRIFLAALGLVYLAAFGSLAAQVDALLGSRGIVPVAPFFDAVRAAEPSLFARVAALPTLLWIDAGDAMLWGLCGAGIALAVCLAAGVAPGPAAAALFLLYLSLATAGREFFLYQWDALLLEAGFLAIFLAPWRLWPRAAAAAPPPAPVVRGLHRWLVFRLFFASGVVKLLAWNPAWRDLTALSFHHETQPLPHVLSWYAHHLPGWTLRAATAAVLAIELAVPILVFGPRLARRVAFVALVGLQIAIAATGNFGFFNLLAAALCVLILRDDDLPGWARRWFGPAPAPAAAATGRSVAVAIRMVLAAALFLLTLPPFLAAFRIPTPGPAAAVYRAIAPLRIANGYGLFANMTTERFEIVIEGSRDGETWREYELRWKPGDPGRAPRFAGPHMPRVDWQLWFLALESPEEHPWLPLLLARILEGSPPVLALFARDPFPEGPPRYVHAVRYRYRFADPATRASTGAWWTREYVELCCPPLARDERPR